MENVVISESSPSQPADATEQTFHGITVPRDWKTPTPNPETTFASIRFYHLDALRSVLMMWGVIVHTSTVGFSPFFENATRLSGWVRMDAFFIVSGFFSYLIIQRYGIKVAIRRRFLAVGVPFITCLLLLNPVTNYLIYSFHNNPIEITQYLKTGGSPEARGPMVWSLHLWFLAVLLIYALLTPLFLRWINFSIPFLKAIIGKNSGWLIFASICGLVALGSLSGRVFQEIALETITPKTFLFIVRSTLTYLPFFMLGMCLFHSPRLLKIFSELHFFHLVLSLFTFFMMREYFKQMPKLLAESLHILASSYLAITLSSLLFFIFYKFAARKSPVTRYLSDASYTVYLFHFIIIYSLSHALRPLFGRTELLLWAVAILTLITTLLIHNFLILKFAALRGLFNGKFQ